MNKWILKNYFCDLFKIQRSEDERFEWEYFKGVEFPYWLVDTLPFVKSFQHCVQWTRARLRRNDESSDDDIPF